MPTCAITLDVHDGDDAAEVLAAHESLRSFGFRATYFVPTALLTDAPMRRALLRMHEDGAEIASHGHRHDASEIEALRVQGRRLDFLDTSADLHAATFGERPSSFRSPCWCGLTDAALDRLAQLGYTADSSATPQRIGLFTSSPSRNPWLTAARSPSFVRPNLLEIPTSSFVIPLGSHALALLRGPGSLAFAGALCAEARLASRVVVVQLHAGDFHAAGGSPRERPSWRDLFPRSGHGWAVRHWTLDLDRRRMHERTLALLAMLRSGGFSPRTLRDAAADLRAERS